METDLVKAMAAVVITKQVVYLAHSLVLAFPSSLLAMAPIGLCVAIGASRTLLKAFASESSASNKGRRRAPFALNRRPQPDRMLTRAKSLSAVVRRYSGRVFSRS